MRPTSKPEESSTISNWHQNNRRSSSETAMLARASCRVHGVERQSLAARIGSVPRCERGHPRLRPTPSNRNRSNCVLFPHRSRKVFPAISIVTKQGRLGGGQMSYRVNPNGAAKDTLPKATIHRSLCIWVQYDWPGPFLTKAKGPCLGTHNGPPCRFLPEVRSVGEVR